MKKITIYVTDEQYEFLLKLRKAKVTTSHFIRVLIELYRNLPAKPRVTLEETVVIKKRRLKHSFGKIQEPTTELSEEAKKVLAEREKRERELRPLLMQELKGLLKERRKNVE